LFVSGGVGFYPPTPLFIDRTSELIKNEEIL
jgi:hypothetical protein